MGGKQCVVKKQPFNDEKLRNFISQTFSFANDVMACGHDGLDIERHLYGGHELSHTRTSENTLCLPTFLFK